MAKNDRENENEEKMDKWERPTVLSYLKRTYENINFYYFERPIDNFWRSVDFFSIFLSYHVH